MRKTLLITMSLFAAMNLFAQKLTQDPFLEKVRFRGAFGADDWTRTWANFDPQNTVYPEVNDTIKGTLVNTTGPTYEYEINADVTLDKNAGAPVFGTADFTDNRLQDAFIEKVDYIGAFGAINWAAGWTNFDPQTTVYPDVNDTIKGVLVNETGPTKEYEIRSNITLKANKTYLLDGWFYIIDGVTVTIEPGTIIRGAQYAAIIAERGGKLMAEGTVDHPIVFTSNQPAGSRAWQDWGGVVLCGKAHLNIPGGEAQIEGGPRTYYGGKTTPDDNDNSGVLKYVRIEFPGYPFQPNKEINGLTHGAVGRGTTEDYIQVSYSGDDSYEWFGGTVNCKHLIAFRGQDDEFDTDNGYSGICQFLVGLRDPQRADVSGSNGFESDNDATGSSNMPYTSATFVNVSLFGPMATKSSTYDPNFMRAMHLRRNTRLGVFNSIFAGYPVGLYIDGVKSQTAASQDSLEIKNCIIAGCKQNFLVNSPAAYFADTTAEKNWFLAASRHNKIYTSNDFLQLVDPFNLTSPNFARKQATYLLDGWFYVTDGHTLTIKPGTVIRGNQYAAIIVERGGKINAEGTVDMPIIFTSNQPAGSRAWQDWGGVVLCGKAHLNIPGGEAQIEGGPRTYYGGKASPDDDDNSGILKYVRIEFPGYPFQPNKEINGLTHGAVGRGTTEDYIQVSYSGDDSYEWFGGTVNCKHLIAFRGQDDEFDTDNGYSGICQFLVGLRDPQRADVSGSNGFESDNDATGSSNMPYTSATFANVSLFGPMSETGVSYDPNFQRAMHLRRNTRLKVYNTVVAGYPVGIFIDGSKSQTAATQDSLQIYSSVVAGVKTKFAVNAPAALWASANDEMAWYLSADRRNDTLNTSADLMIEDPYNLDAPNFLPKSNSALLGKSIWTLASVAIVGGNSISADNGTLQLGTNVMPKIAIDTTVTWKSLNTNLATVSETGLVTAIRNGDVKIVATAKDDASFADTVTIALTNQIVPVSSILVSGEGGVAVISTSSTLQMHAAILPVDASNADVTWSVDNESLATISSTGLLSALQAGTVVVKATAADGSEVMGTLSVVISNSVVAVTSITVTAEGNATEIAGMGTLQLTAVIAPENASQKEVSWSVDNESVATISQTGMLTAVDNGTVTVTATALDGSNVKGTIQIVIRGVAVQKIHAASFLTFPNPVLSVLQIKAENSMNLIKVHNMLGQVVNSIHAEGMNDAEVDMSALHPGVYLISVEMENGVVAVKKVLKK